MYTDGSAEEAVQNGGAGIYIKYPSGEEEKHAFATGTYSSNYKAESEAIKTGANILKQKELKQVQVVFFTDAKSVLQALEGKRDIALNDLMTSLALLCTECTVVLQWIPSHCGIAGNEIADNLAKEGAKQYQEDKTTSYEEAKAIIKNTQRKLWLTNHQHYNKNDPYHLLNRQHQVIIFRLRTGHCKLRHHLFNKFGIGESDQCPCNAAAMTVDHILQDCPSLNIQRNKIWPTAVTVHQKLYGSLEDLQDTAAFVEITNLSI